MTRQQQWIDLIVGVAVIASYSVIMMASSGDGGSSWLLLLAGVVVLAVTRMRSRAGSGT